jgi:hypothetical protein
VGTLRHDLGLDRGVCRIDGELEQHREERLGHVTRRGPTRIEVVPEGSAAEGFVYDFLADAGVETMTFEADDQTTDQLLNNMQQLGAANGFAVDWEQRAGVLVVRVTKARHRHKFQHERCPAGYHEALKRDLETFRGGTHPAGTRQDDEEKFEMGHCARCGSTLEMATKRKNPPRWVRDTDVWYRAVDKVKPYWKKYQEPYAVVASTYQRMGGRSR